MLLTYFSNKISARTPDLYIQLPIRYLLIGNLSVSQTSREEKQTLSPPQSVSSTSVSHCFNALSQQPKTFGVTFYCNLYRPVKVNLDSQHDWPERHLGTVIKHTVAVTGWVIGMACSPFLSLFPVVLYFLAVTGLITFVCLVRLP